MKKMRMKKEEDQRCGKLKMKTQKEDKCDQFKVRVEDCIISPH